MDNLIVVTCILSPISSLLIGIVLLGFEYYVFVPINKISDAGDDSGNKAIMANFIPSVIASLVAGIIFSAIAYFAYDKWSTILLCIAYSFLIVIAVLVFFYVHNLFYGATFLVIRYLYQDARCDYSEALNTLHEIKRVRPDDPYPFIQQALVYSTIKQYRPALSAIDQALSMTDNRLDILKVKKDILWELVDDYPGIKSNWEILATTLESILTATPDNIELHYDLAEAYFYLDRRTLGIDKLKTLISTLVYRAKALEENSSTRPARTKLWSLVKAQIRIIELLDNVLVKHFSSGKKINSPEVLEKIRNLVIAVEQIKETGKTIIGVHQSIAELYFSLGEYHQGFDVIQSFADTYLKTIKSIEARSQYYEAKQQLWIMVEFLNAVINIQENSINMEEVFGVM